MPEGHSLRRLALTFDEWFVGSACELTSPQGRFIDGAALLSGRVMSQAHSVGKHLFLRFDEGTDGNVACDEDQDPATPNPTSLWLHVHLGLYGAWKFYAENDSALAASIGAPRTSEEAAQAKLGNLGEMSALRAPQTEGSQQTRAAWAPPEPQGAVRVRIETQRVAADLSGPNQCEVLTEDEVTELVDRLGPDPLGPHAHLPETAEQFAQKIRSSKRAIGELVMDQTFIAGVGNIYRAEGLFRQGISPYRKGANVSRRRLLALWDDYVDLMEEGVESGDIRSVEDRDKPDPGSDAEAITLDLDPESLKWYVYHREGRECLRCGAPVREKEMQGRRLFWCSSCQR